MNPLFSPSTDLVGWLNDDGFVYDLSMNPVAFVSEGHAFSYPNCSWLGSADGPTLRDKMGKPIAFNPGQAPGGTLPPLKPLNPLKPLKPLKPLRPLNPLKPLRPLTPLGGWSPLSFHTWLQG
jgi:hypothetical protein